MNSIPLSFSQQRLWLISALGGNNQTRYNKSFAWQLQGKLNTAAIYHALQTIVQRHESLRSSFNTIDGKPEQIIHNHNALHFFIVDVTAQHVNDYIQQRSACVFNLSCPPLIRLTVLRLSDYRHLLLINMHHIVTDDLSMQVFASELNCLYNRTVDHSNTALPAPALQYRDFTLWQIEQAKKQPFSQQLDYWRQQLDQAPAALALNTDYRRAEKNSHCGKTLRFCFSSKLIDGINQFSHNSGNSTFAIFLAAFVLLLSRYSQQQDVCIGSPVANRQRECFKKLIGFFANTLVLRCRVNNSQCFADLVKHVEAVRCSAYQHQDVPFEKVLEAVNPPRSTRYSPLFQVMFFIEHTLDQYIHLNQIKAASIDIDATAAKYDISLILQQSDAGIGGGLLEYNTGLFQAASIERIIRHFKTLLQHAINDPGQCVTALSMMDEQEKKQLLYDWNSTAATCPNTHSIHQYFEQHVASTPDAIAVSYKDQQLSYSQLNVSCNRLAHFLLSQGVEAESRVGVQLHRGVDLVISMLAVLKAGACYLPIDPGYPRQRIDYLIDNSRISVLLTHSDCAASSSQHSGVSVVALDKCRHIVQRFATTTPATKTLPLNLAYVNYTSGSTGQPKGVAITHQGVIRLVVNNTRLPLKTACKLLQVSSISFDLATFEIWGALLNAGRCVLYPGQAPTPWQLEKTINENKVDTLWLTSALFNLVIDEKPGALKQVRYLLAGGEALCVEHIKKATEQLPGVQLFNGYGPTENTTFSTCYAIAQSPVATMNSVPIGRPINHTSAYILDHQLNPVAIGVTGELYTAGDGLARGYLFNPALSAEKFIANPFATIPGQRLYKTGDLARYLDNGCIDFVGRVDRQVKIRGYRIEPGEIEQILIGQPSIRSAVVTSWKVSPDHSSRALVAYLVAEDHHGTATAQDKSTNEAQLEHTLRTVLQQQLPDYMVPSRFIFLSQLPLSDNGKTHYSQLPSPACSQSAGPGHVAPVTAIEKTLCRIWQDILQVNNIGTHDNFFACGGDSILLLQIISRARQAGINMTAQLLLNHQTIAALAQHCTTTQSSISQQPATGSMRLLPVQQWFFATNSDGNAHFNQYCLWHTPADFIAAFLHLAVAALYQRHDALRLRYRIVNGQWQAHFATFSTTMVAETIEVHQLPDTRPASLRFMEQQGARIQASLDIEHGPLFKAVYFKSDNAQCSRLLFVIHHLVVDGVSWRILQDDLTTAYNQWRRKQTLALPARTHSVADWADALYRYSASDTLQAQCHYWLKQLSVATTALPRDKALQQRTDYSAIGAITFELSEQQTYDLLTRCQHSYRTRINELLLAALALAFEQWTQQPALQVLLEGHGREELAEAMDISQTVGWFTSMFPLTLQWPGCTGNTRNTGITDSPLVANNASTTDPANIKALIVCIKEQLRSIPANGIGYGVLHYLANHKQLQRQQQQHKPEIVFNYLGQFDSSSDDKQFFTRAGESVGNRTGASVFRDHVLRFTGEVTHRKLRFTLDYDTRQYYQQTMDNLSQLFKQALTTIIQHCLHPDSGSYTPCDFPLARLDSATLARWQQDYPTLENIYPATAMQMGLLYHSLRDCFAQQHAHYLPTALNYSYVTQLYFSIDTPLNIACFKQAWEQVIARHDILRTAFVGFTSKQVLQLVVKQLSLNWLTFDWRDKSTQAFTDAFEQYRRHDKHQGFNYHQPGLMRFCVFIHRNNHIRFLWTHHHSLLDGWSIAIVLQEVFSAYQAQLDTTSPSPALAPAGSYHHYVRWLLQQDKNKAMQFWRNELRHARPGKFTTTSQPDKHCPPGLSATDKAAILEQDNTVASEHNKTAIPQQGNTTASEQIKTAKPERSNTTASEQIKTATPEQSNTTVSEQNKTVLMAAPAEQQLCLSEHLTEKLQQFALHHQVTLNSVIQAVWAYLLHRYSGSEDIVFGETITVRPAELAGSESTVGLFINTLPVRIAVNHRQSIGEWLQAIQKAHHRRQQFGYLPLVDIQQCCDPGGHSALFNSVMVFQIDAATALQNSNMAVSHLCCDEQTHYDLTLLITPSATLTLQLKYFANHFSATSIEQLLKNVHDTVNALINDSTLTVGDLPPLIDSGYLSAQRPAITVPATNTVGADLPFTPASTAVEKQLVTLWSEVLDLSPDNISIYDNFFTLGGHSLLAITVIARLCNMTPVTLTLEDFFDRPSIFQLAQYICTISAQHDVFASDNNANHYLQEKGIL